MIKELHQHTLEQNSTTSNSAQVRQLAMQSFSKIAPYWPLQNLIAVNPLHGFEDLPIEEALTQAAAYFQQPDIPEPMLAVNRLTIKWLQSFFDDGQATLSMPLRNQGLYAAWRQLALYDIELHGDNNLKRDMLRELPKSAEQAITDYLLRLGIAKEQRLPFLTLMLTTLPGWAGYIKYRTEWTNIHNHHPHPVYREDYLAIRLIMTRLFWPEAKRILDWHQEALVSSQAKNTVLEKLQSAENAYRIPLLKQLSSQTWREPHTPEAQLVFCIDVRSEPFRKSLESTGDYSTYGFAGFFGVPVQITDTVTNESYTSCPVLLSPKHEVKESPCAGHCIEQDRQGYTRLTTIKRIYQSVKYTFTTPFGLVESLGMSSGIWMGFRTLAPRLADKLKKGLVKKIRRPQLIKPALNNISLHDQCSYAENALKMMGLTKNFAPLVVFCGHGSVTQNNAYATALDCGACGGRHGASNARILAEILNCPQVRRHLGNRDIVIPNRTQFIAAEHNTTTDEVTLFVDQQNDLVDKLKKNLEKARQLNSYTRLQKMGLENNDQDWATLTMLRSQDWAQVRPEWGLARNAAFIVAPREMTAALNLEGRCFLHSYDYQQDPEGSSLATILTAPMVVAEWINTHYLFSTLDNVAYGGGSKITKNITGKIGIMQGNSSDLMTGLPLQSVYISDNEAYHEAQRLMTVVFAPCDRLDAIIATQPVLQKLFGNGWVQLTCIDPHNRNIYFLNRDLIWQKIS